VGQRAHIAATGLPFTHLNLQRNPFGEPPPGERTALVVADVEALADQLMRPGKAIQLMGEHGRGKTSRLLALQSRLSDRLGQPVPYVRLRDDRAIPAGRVILLDEGALLPRRAWWRLLRVGSLAVSTHLNLKALLWPLGFQVRTHRVAGVDAARLAQIFERRLEWARWGPGPIPTIPRVTIETLIGRYGDDVRSMEGALYDRIQAMDEVCDVQV
jgi:hypothetical protein